MQNFDWTDEQKSIRTEVRALAAEFDDEYWSQCDEEHRFPTEFFRAFAEGGWLGIAMPPEYGGAGLGITEAAIVLGEVAASGSANNGPSALHLTIFGLNPLVKHGSPEMKQRYLPDAISGELQFCFSVTEPDAGSDTTRISTRAVRDGDVYRVTGQKVWMSKAQHAHKAILLTRTTPLEQVKRKTDGMSLLIADVNREYLTIREIAKVGRNAIDSNEVFIDGLPVPASDLVGEEGKGFYYLLDGVNPERILVAAEAVGIGRAALRRAVQYAKERVVFGRPIGANQGIQFPLALAYARLEAAEMMQRKAAWLYDQGLPCGAEANIAKYLAGEAGYFAADRAVQTLGGFGFAREYHVERYWREARLLRVAPISEEMILNYVSQHTLGLPRSY